MHPLLRMANLYNSEVMFDIIFTFIFFLFFLRASYKNYFLLTLVKKNFKGLKYFKKSI